MKIAEATNKIAVMTFGRMNPPTVAHKHLFDKMQKLAGQTNADVHLFLSQTQDAKKNPLGFKSKKYFVQNLLGTKSVVDKPEVKTPVDALNWLTAQGYEQVYFVVGSDRIKTFQDIINSYNGKPTKEGIIPFNFPGGVKMVSAGERDPDSDAMSGMSASKLRDLAVQGNFKSFASGVPSKDNNLKKKMYDELRRKMGVTNMTEGDDRIVPQGGTGSWTQDTLIRNVVKEMHILTTMLERGDASNVYHHLTKGSIVNKIKALADIQNKE